MEPNPDRIIAVSTVKTTARPPRGACRPPPKWFQPFIFLPLTVDCWHRCDCWPPFALAGVFWRCWCDYPELVLVQRSGCGLSAIPAWGRGGHSFPRTGPVPLAASIEIKARVNGHDSNTLLLPLEW